MAAGHTAVAGHRLQHLDLAACETLHFIGLALVIGIVGFFDLRLMGFFSRVSGRRRARTDAVAVAGFLLNLMTGLVFFVGHPEQYAHNPAWWWKVGFLASPDSTRGVFETDRRRADRGASGRATTRRIAAKAIGVVSLVAWFGVLYWGRMLPFIGDAY